MARLQPGLLFLVLLSACEGPADSNPKAHAAPEILGHWIADFDLSVGFDGNAGVDADLLHAEVATRAWTLGVEHVFLENSTMVSWDREGTAFLVYDVVSRDGPRLTLLTRQDPNRGGFGEDESGALSPGKQEWLVFGPDRAARREGVEGGEFWVVYRRS